MIVLQFPFDMKDSDMKEGFKIGQEERFQSTKPDSDTELAMLVWDLLQDGSGRIKYNVGFLMGLYKQQENPGQVNSSSI